ncbi:hypothetical protein A1O1_07440 [Capronia coronata CBS 617.96]|uniref:Myb-like DNA-binding domain-containing protein n=1 Tax=Capronia coronata CBS 617.96 TaxID=1182541 RepID=W9XU99_9EURO|nr:uncharacterized protein A1O1_07440 [Capronia coronata CBS 617.96]EXJ83813.1 hypothetical protein A1O1_07440 [Capronia coronata CBS 617.96]
MPPKTSTAAGGGDATDASFKFVFSVLKHCETIKPNWDEVAKENGIGYARNASSKFKDIVKKHGLEFKNGVILDPADPTLGGPASDTTPTKRAKATTPRKRKSEDSGSNTPKSSGKKKKSAPIFVKEEEEEDDDDDQEKVEETVKPEPEDTTEDVKTMVKAED